jgi:hypothetical protein
MTERSRSRSEAKAKGRLFYIGAPCHACGFRKRYTSTKACYACRKQRALDVAEIATLAQAERKAAKERQAARRCRAMAQQAADNKTFLEFAIVALLERIKDHDSRE